MSLNNLLHFNRAVPLNNSIVGLAFVGTMCDSRQSVGLSLDELRSLEEVGSTAAHELGHIFNMQHDDDEFYDYENSEYIERKYVQFMHLQYVFIIQPLS